MGEGRQAATKVRAGLQRPWLGSAPVTGGFPPFRPRPPWLGRDLQTIRNAVLRPGIDLVPWPGQRLWLPLADGSGDELAATLHMGRARGPLVVLVHGLCGCEDSFYVRASARYHLSRGHPVVRLNLRGAEPSRQGCRGHYHAGRSEDLRRALTALGELSGGLMDNGVMLVGFSLGGTMLAKFLAESGEDFPVRAAALVSAPLDLAATQRQFMRPRNRAYHAYMLRRMKAEALAPPASLSRRERRVIARVRSVYEFDDRFIARRFGFAGADDYYARSSAERFLGVVAVPTLVVHALDDPWIPPAAYERFPWSSNQQLLPLLSPKGGHLGFHGRGSHVPWHDRCVGRFFDRALV